MSEFKYKILKNLAVLSETKGGWTKEFNIISWNDRTPKYDIRDWSPDRYKMNRGLSFNAEELIQLRDILNGMDIKPLTEESFE